MLVGMKVVEKVVKMAFVMVAMKVESLVVKTVDEKDCMKAE